MEIYAWMLGIAIIFTVFGYYSRKTADAETIVSYTIESLIEGGYIRTAIVDGEQVLVPWDAEQ